MASKRGEEWEEYDKAVMWIWGSVAVGFIVLYLSLTLLPVINYLVQHGTDAESWAVAKKNMFRGIPDLLTYYSKWMKRAFNFKNAGVFQRVLPFVPIILWLMTMLIGILVNPFRMMSNVHGSGRMATTKDIEKMKLFKGFIIVLGKWKGKFLKLPETLSVLAVAPPGTGKTVGIVVPTILESYGQSIIVNDPKPELCYTTSGFRASMGPVFIINWGAEDDPEKGIYYPSWNPLSGNCLPPPGPSRDMYIDSMVAVLVEEPKGGADPHWSKTGRSALSGLMHFIISKCERARANDYFITRIYEGKLDSDDSRVLEGYYMDMSDPTAMEALKYLREGKMDLDHYAQIGTWETLPDEWIGAEPCIPLILDWMTEAQMAIAADIKRRTEAGDQSAAFSDPMRDMLDRAVTEAKRFSYSHRAILELNQLGATPDKERGSILSTALTGIGIFKNSAVRARTRLTDITFKDLRGMKNPRSGKWEPVAVYLSVNQVDAGALSVITGTFVELMSRFLVANPPNTKRSDGDCGPFPVLFVLDEFPQMPKIAAVKDGPAVGRGQKVSYLLIGQDLGQISGQYGKDDLETIITTTAAKVILAQNNEVTAQRFEKMIGTKTIETQSTSKTEGYSKNITPFSSNVSRQLQSSAVVGASTMLSLPPTKQLVIFQGYLNRPIMADAPRWFLDPKMKEKCAMKPSPNVPKYIVDMREGQVDRLSEIIAEEEEKERLNSLQNPDAA